MDAASLCKMADRGQITGGLLDGPLAFDNAISPVSVATKGIVSDVAGIADILVAPDLEAANMMAKQLIYLAGADAAGIVLGARVPIILTSRADSPVSRLASCALAQLFINHQTVTLPSLCSTQAPPASNLRCIPVRRAARHRSCAARSQGLAPTRFFLVLKSVGVAVPQASPLPLDPAAGQDDLIPKLLDWLNSHRGGVTIRAAGHRVVHGGPHRDGPALVTEALLADLEALVPLAPMHQPHNLAAIRCVATSDSDLPQVACFDTSFHRTQDRLSQLFALPRSLTDEGILRYGFHGLSYEYIAGTLPTHLGDRADGRVIVAHLGSGASMCAMKDRRSVATSMGFTALDGLMMGRRCGTLDAGVVLFLMQEKGLTAEEITTLLYKQSGLLGVSGITNDMAVLEASEDARAQEAMELFCYRAARELTALATDMGGIDAIVFTAGIGENSALVRRLICQRLAWLGVDLDVTANERGIAHIHSTASDVSVIVIPTDEEAVIAAKTRMLTCSV